MSVQDLVNGRKSVEIDGEEDFVVGKIAGLDDDKPTSKRGKATAKTQSEKGEVINMTTTVVAENVNIATSDVTPEQLEGTVELKLKKEYAKLVDIIANANEGVIIQDLGTHYQLNAKQIRVTRQDAERSLGKMNDGRWRMVLINRKGDVASFNDYELVLGIVETEVEEAKELAQINTRILSEAKIEMDTVRSLLGMTQSQFLETAIKEYAEKVRAEML